ncbi:MAG: pilus assembly PilX N-terminal domain-containing protein [Burkholderiaceae bacterium]|nr:pilus assembly PilX N-terminal domain-containing protein [Burkholderiaceae bacterium]
MNARRSGVRARAHPRGIVSPAHPRGIVSPAHQRGIVLFVALIAMVVLGLAAAALIRSSDTSAVIAGNLAFKDGATHAADTGVERAFVALPALAAGDVDVPNRYFRLIQPVDARGVPTSVVWANVPCYDVAGGAIPISCADGSSYRVQYVIERLCRQAPVPAEPVTTLTGKCVAGQPFSVSGNVGNDRDSHTPSGGYGVPPVTGTLPPTIHYRVTVRVQGPRNTASLVQATIELPYI